VWKSVKERKGGKDELLLWKRRSGRVDKVSEDAKDETEALRDANCVGREAQDTTCVGG
jgi:hypothetical protein